MVGTESRTRERDTWAIGEAESIIVIHFRASGPDEHILTFPFLLAFALVLSHL